jgi:signal transduction histidine kinase
MLGNMVWLKQFMTI